MPTYSVKVLITSAYDFTITAATSAEAKELGEEHAWLETSGEAHWTQKDMAYLRDNRDRVLYNPREDTLEAITVEETSHGA